MMLYRCPSCGAAYEVSQTPSRTIQCPGCGGYLESAGAFRDAEVIDVTATPIDGDGIPEAANTDVAETSIVGDGPQAGGGRFAYWGYERRGTGTPCGCCGCLPLLLFFLLLFSMLR